MSKQTETKECWHRDRKRRASGTSRRGAQIEGWYRFESALCRRSGGNRQMLVCDAMDVHIRQMAQRARRQEDARLPVAVILHLIHLVINPYWTKQAGIDMAEEATPCSHCGRPFVSPSATNAPTSEGNRCAQAQTPRCKWGIGDVQTPIRASDRPRRGRARNISIRFVGYRAYPVNMASPSRKNSQMARAAIRMVVRSIRFLRETSLFLRSPHARTTA